MHVEHGRVTSQRRTNFCYRTDTCLCQIRCSSGLPEKNGVATQPFQSQRAPDEGFMAMRRRPALSWSSGCCARAARTARQKALALGCGPSPNGVSRCLRYGPAGFPDGSSRPRQRPYVTASRIGPSHWHLRQQHAQKAPSAGRAHRLSRSTVSGRSRRLEASTMRVAFRGPSSATVAREE